MNTIARAILPVCIILSLANCATHREAEGLPPVVFSDKATLAKQLGKVGVLRQNPEVSTETMTDNQLFRKEVWNRIAQGSLTSLKWYERELHPMQVVTIGCLESKKQCRETKIVIGSLALVAMAVGGITGGVTAEYSENLVREMRVSLLREVRDLNDQLQTSVLAAANARVFDRAYAANRSDGWASHAFDALKSKQFMDLSLAPDDAAVGTVAAPGVSASSEIDSMLAPTIVKVHFTDDDVWLSSKVELRVEAMTRISSVKDGAVIDERRYECVSVPRSLGFWAIDSYRHVREEITTCTHLFGQQIANDLLGASITINGK